MDTEEMGEIMFGLLTSYRVARDENRVPGGKEFAKETLEWLRSLPLVGSAAEKLIRISGPGQVREALQWMRDARYALTDTSALPDGFVNDRGVKDALDMVLSGLGGSTGFGKDRTLEALAALRIPVSTLAACSSTRMFRILAGAKEFNRLLP